jgi:Tol biopolymer transport system component
LVRGPVASPIWSPDGSSIAYVDQFAGAGPVVTTVRLVSLSTRAVTTLRIFPAKANEQSPPRVALLSWQPH